MKNLLVWTKFYWSSVGGHMLIVRTIFEDSHDLWSNVFCGIAIQKRCCTCMDVFNPVMCTTVFDMVYSNWPYNLYHVVMVSWLDIRDINYSLLQVSEKIFCFLLDLRASSSCHVFLVWPGYSLQFISGR